MPAVLVSGSIVTSIMVSERGGPSCTSTSRASKPMKRILMRLAPSQAGGSSATGATFGVGGRSTGTTSVPSGLKVPSPFDWPQLAGAIPGRLVKFQHAVNLPAKTKAPTLKATVTTQKINCPMDNFGNFIFFKNSNLFIIFYNLMACHRPYPVQVFASLPAPNIAAQPILHLGISSSQELRDDHGSQTAHVKQLCGCRSALRSSL